MSVNPFRFKVILTHFHRALREGHPWEAITENHVEDSRAVSGLSQARVGSPNMEALFMKRMVQL